MNVQELKDKAKAMGLQYHHRATKRGYICKSLGYAEEYNGRFGEGLALHLPNCECSIDNSYHYIEYYTKQY